MERCISQCCFPCYSTFSSKRQLVSTTRLFVFVPLSSCCCTTSTELGAASCSLSTPAATSTAALNGTHHRGASVLSWYVEVNLHTHRFKLKHTTHTSAGQLPSTRRVREQHVHRLQQSIDPRMTIAHFNRRDC